MPSNCQIHRWAASFGHFAPKSPELTVAECIRLLGRMRQFLEPVWPHGSGGECEETSMFICKVFGRCATLTCGTDWRRLPNGRGTKLVDSGYWNETTKRWCSHYWVNIQLGNVRYIADLTADQFGGPKVVFVKSPHSNYLPNDPEVTEMFQRPRFVVQEVNEWYRQWLEWCHHSCNKPEYNE